MVSGDGIGGWGIQSSGVGLGVPTALLDPASLPELGEIWLYGRGEGGQRIRRVLEAFGVKRITGFIDSTYDGECDGLPVYSLVRLERNAPKGLSIIICSYQYYGVMLNSLHDMLFKLVFDGRPLLNALLEVEQEADGSAGAGFLPRYTQALIRRQRARSLADLLRDTNLTAPPDLSDQPAAAGLLTELRDTGGGLVPDRELAVLHNLARLIRPEHSLEIGLWKGSTAIAILAASATRHTAIDPFQSAIGNAGSENIARAGYANRFSIIPEYSEMALPRMAGCGGPRFDFIYIDSAHYFDCTMIEWFYANRLLHVGGVVAFDDCDTSPGVAGVVNFVERNHAYIVLRPTGRTWIAVKCGVDQREREVFSPFGFI